MRSSSSAPSSSSSSSTSAAPAPPRTRLARAVAAVRAGGSSAVSVAEFAAATLGMSRRQRAAFALKRRADESRVTQLRGIFAAYDEDRDGLLAPDRELPVALLALGLEPSARTVQHFTLATPTGNVDLATFVRVCMMRAGAGIPGAAASSPGGPAAAGGSGAPEANTTTEGRIAALFLEFDSARTGRVTLQTLLHVLAEVDSPTALSVDEINELLRLTGILNESTLRDPRALYAMDVDYRAFVRHLLFAPPPLPPASSAGAAGAPAAQQQPLQLQLQLLNAESLRR